MILHDINGYENYKVTDDLRVWSCKSGKFLTSNNARGNVSLYKNGVRKVFSRDMLYKIVNPIDTSDFKRIPGLHGYYANKKGEIYSDKWDRVLTPSIDSDGYLVVSIYSGNGAPKNKKVHRLVAITFIPNPNGYETIDHLNNIKTDNRVENLEWCTASENTHRQWVRKRSFKGEM